MADYAIHDTTLIGTSNIIRKKEGSSALIDPADYPKRINLMGMLEEKTVSGSIAHITDGADTVPIKSWEVEIAPTLTGKSAIECTQINSDNLFLLPSNDFSVSGVDFKIASDSLTIDGTSTANISSKDSNFKTYFSFGLPKGTYYFTRGTWTKATYVYKLADDSTALVTNSGSFTLTDYTEIYIGFYIGTGQTVSEVTFDGYLKQGSSASSYSPQPHPTTYTAQLGRTIYGGTADIVKGEGKDTTLRYELDENDSWSAYSGASHSFWHNVATGEDRPIKQTEASESICNYATYSRASPSSAPDFSFLIQGGQRIVVTADSSIDTVDKFKTWLSSHNLVFVCPASTPTDFTFTPITPTPETALGVNNFWADEGDSEIEYRSSGTVHQYPEGEGVSF